jgi:hypothetical protein
LRSDLRYEIKLVCDQYRLAQARYWIRLHPAGFIVAFPPRRVNSLYLDTLHLSSLQGNLQGLNVRQKLRLRWYGDEMMRIQPYLELKQKRSLLGAKTRYLLPHKLDMAARWSDILKTICANVTANWRALLQTVEQPTLLNHYQREYYVTSDGAVRVTLDWAQAAYDQRLSPRPNLCFPLPITDSVVIEVKAGQNQAERLEEIVAQFPVHRSRNSKYVGSLLTALG